MARVHQKDDNQKDPHASEVYEEKKNQRAPPAAIPEYIERVEIIPFDDGWPEYEDPVYDF